MFHYNEFDNVTGKTNMVKLFGLSRVSQGKEVTNLEEATSFFLYNAVVPWNKLYKKVFLLKIKYILMTWFAPMIEHFTFES